jgi:hypothetical protein
VRRPIKDLVAPGRFLLIDGDLFDPRCTWLRHRQITSNGALLVRPDRFIGWRHMTMAPKPSRGASQRARTGPGTSARPGEAIRLGPGPGLNLAPGCPHILSVARSAGAATAVTDQHPGMRRRWPVTSKHRTCVTQQVG